MSVVSAGTLLVEAEGVSKAFPGVEALSDVDFDLRAGEIHAIVGENGAGKSTFVKILTGLLRPDRGRIRILGRPAHIRDPNEAERLGISAIQQELSLVPQLDVAHNILLGHIPTRRTGLGRFIAAIDRQAVYAQATRALSTVGAEIEGHEPARSLGPSQAQLVLLARALSRDMQVLILDEPTAALTPTERDELFRRIRTLQGRGVGILYISHHLDEVLTLADRTTVFRDGKRIATVQAGDVTVEHLIGLMLDRSIEEMYPHKETELGSLALEIRGVSRGSVLDDVSFVVRAGEIVGVTGLVGAGKTELARAIFGADTRDSGEVVFGTTANPGTPGDAIKGGMALVPEDRKSQGLMGRLSVKDNMATGIINGKQRQDGMLRFRQFLSRARLEEVVREFISRFRIRARSLDQVVGDLSGGNQQKVVLAKCLATGPRVMILDEPTRGLDVGSKVEIYEAMENLAQDGVAILMLSSEPEEVIRMSDRVLVMRKGRVVAELDRGEATLSTVMRYASSSNGGGTT